MTTIFDKDRAGLNVTNDGAIPANLTTVRFIFDRTPAGVVVLDDLGFRK